MALSVLFLGFSAPSPATAQQWVRFHGWQGRLAGSTAYEHEDVSSGGQDSTQERLFFREELFLRTGGSIVHPNLVSFSLGGNVAGVQDEFQATAEDTTTKQSGDEVLLGYDGTLTFVRNLPYNFDVFGSRAEANVRRDFVGRTKVKSERFGSTLRGTELPLSPRITLQEERLKQRLVGAQVQQDERRRSIDYRGRRRGETTDIKLDYRLEDIDDRLREAGSFNLQTIGLTHVWRVSPDAKRQLFSSASAFIRDGTSSNTTSVTETETLRWQFTRSLWSDYNYSFSRFSGEDTETTTHRGSVGLRHKWYESLSTSLHAEASFAEFDQGDERDYGGGIGWSYIKRIPWNGRLSLDLAGSYLLADRDVPPGLISIFEERHIFTDSRPFVLENLDVVPSTIEIKNASGKVFTKGSDYTVEQVDRLTEIRRNPLGLIPENEILLVSYSSEIGGSFKIGSRPMSYGAGLDFGWVRFSYSGERLRQDVFSGDPEATLGEVDSDIVELTFLRRSRALDLEANNEYRKYRSDELRFSSFSFTQIATWYLPPWLRVQLLGSERFHDFEKPKRTREFFRGRASVSWQPRYNVTASTFAGIRRQEETDIPNETFTEAGIRVSWNLDRLSLDFSYDRDMHELGTGKRTGDLVQLEISRSF